MGCRVKARRFAAILCTTSSICALLSLSACVPTYPKEKLPEAVKAICKIEYNMDVDVTVTGTTMGIYYAMGGLFDAGLGISDKSWDTISNLLLIASRVVLSTDADINFYCVITQDVRLPELQVVIIKHVEDIKHGMYSNISRDESFKRTLFSINLTPQARKERTIERIFNKLVIEEETRQKVLNEFFRSQPTKLNDIGYWKDKFYIKEINMEEFLASQIANRIKIDFRNDKKLLKLYEYNASEGLFVSAVDERFFLIKFKIADIGSSDKGNNLRIKKIKEIIRIANEVVYGYKFKKFGFLILEDQSENVTLKINEEDVYNFNKKQLVIENIVQAPAGYF